MNKIKVYMEIISWENYNTRVIYYNRNEVTHMIGIYKITNQINGHSYIGLSTNIHSRWLAHLSPRSWERDSENPLYRAFIKYGTDNFKFEVLEECEPEELGEREKYYIALYNTYYDGYNRTPGGQDNRYGTHPNHKLTKEDVIDIRTRYGNLERCNEVYELYKDCIGKSGFSKVWKGETWKGIMEEVYTPENKRFHAHNTGNKGSKNGRARLNEEDVRTIRLRRKNGENIREVYKDYADKLTYGSFSNVWTYQNWKNIVV